MKGWLLNQTEYGWEYNPFNKESCILNGIIHWKANDEVNLRHLDALFEASKFYHRKLHINTGTHGEKDGSTIFW